MNNPILKWLQAESEYARHRVHQRTSEANRSVLKNYVADTEAYIFYVTLNDILMHIFCLAYHKKVVILMIIRM